MTGNGFDPGLNSAGGPNEGEFMALEPSGAAAIAYLSGYRAEKTGGRNPYVYFDARRGPALSGWWEAGFSDAKAGKPSRVHSSEGR